MIRDLLDREVKAWTAMGLGKTTVFKRLVLDRGVVSNGSELPARIKRRPSGFCFENSYQLARRSKGRLRYVEGFAVRPWLGIAMHHGWNLDPEGRVIDTTWNDPAECEYLGIAMDVKTTARLRAITRTASAFMDAADCWVPEAMDFIAPGCADEIKRAA